ncbi:MAG: CHC2 zinc finger domain-containing protein, partial [bacterium]
PFHDDDTPSFVVTPAKGLWHCFGCDAGGDVIAFVMKQQGVSFRHAVELLQANAPLLSTPTRTAPKLPSPVELTADASSALSQVARYYHQTLQKSPEALAYLEARGISSTAAIARFRLGYANRTLGLRLPQRNRVDGERLRGQLEELGVFRKSGHEHLAGSLVVPFFDGDNVVGMYGRKVNDNLRAGTAKHLYLPGPHRGVFNVDGMVSTTTENRGEVILCEAVIDALTFWCAGFENVTASFGVEGFTDEMLAALKNRGATSVLIAYDRDAAGDAAAAALTKKLEGEGLLVGRVLFPRGFDANSYALKVTPSAKALGVVLDEARRELATRHAVVVASLVEPDVDADVASFDSQSEEVVTMSAETTPPAATPLAAVSPATTTVETSTPAMDELVIQLEDRRYRVRGLQANTTPAVLKVNLMVHRGRAFFVDTVDLYQAKQRTLFMVAASRELGVDDGAIKRDLAELLVQLEQKQQEMLAALLSPTKREAPTLTEEEQREALALLQRKDLVDVLLKDFERCGVVGETDNKLLGYLAMTSRKMPQPLAVVVQSSSAAGKSSLMEAVLAFCPDEDKSKFSAMTGQSLFYMGQADLKHQVLAIVEEEGASRASYSLKLMQSEGELTIAAPGKDPTTGRLVTTPYKVDGPVMLFLTTTSIDVDEELMNRCLVLSVDEDREQTRAIHRLQRQRRTLEGRLLARERSDVVTLHQNAQRLLRNIEVVNPFAPSLTFVDDKTRTRRDHMKYLQLIEAIAFLHQHQRPILRAEQHGKSFDYVEVTVDDIRLANRLAHTALGRSLDELPPQTRKLLDAIDAYVVEVCKEKNLSRDQVRLTRRELLDV